jgi:hypothetical protein
MSFGVKGLTLSAVSVSVVSPDLPPLLTSAFHNLSASVYVLTCVIDMVYAASYTNILICYSGVEIALQHKGY